MSCLISVTPHFYSWLIPSSGGVGKRGIIVNNREKAIAFGYEVSEWVGEMAIAYSPAMFSIGMAMVAVSIALRGAIATNVLFDVAWAIVTAICVDGLWLGVWLRLSDSRITDWTSGLRYMATLLVALLMFAVGAAMSVLVTFQQVNGVSDELIAMHTLHIDSLTFIVARGLLVMLCASLAILFKLKKSEPIVPKKATPKSTPKAIVATPEVTITQVTNPQLVALPAPTHSQEYEAIKAIMAMPGGQPKSYKAISDEANVGYSTVKKWAPKIKKELQGGN